MFYSHLGNPNKQRIDAMFNNTLSKSEEEALLLKAIEGINGLTKADEIGILCFDGSDIEKGRRAMPIGSHATWGGVDYLKTASGWKPSGKLRGKVKENHDHIHNNEDKDKDHHALTMDAGNMDEATWTAKHGAGLHAKYKDVHDYLHTPKKDKPAQEKYGKDHIDQVHKDAADLSVTQKTDMHVIKRPDGEHVVAPEGDQHLDKDAKHVATYSKGSKKPKTKDVNLAGSHSGANSDYSSEAVAARDKASEIKKHGESLKAGDDVTVYPGHKELEHTAKVVQSFGNAGVKIDKGDGKHAVYAREDMKSTVKHEADTNKSGDPETGKEYDHYAFGKVKVKVVHKDDGENRKRTTVEFTTSTGKTELQGIDGFNTSLAEHKKAGKSFHDEQMEKFDKEKNDSKSEEEIINKLTNTERSFYNSAKSRDLNLDLKNINSLADKIAALDGGGRKVEHFAEALMYDQAQKDTSEDSKHFGKIDPSDIMTGLKNPNYDFPSLGRLDEVGILPKETKADMKQATELFKKVGELDSKSKALLTVFQSRVLEDKPAKEQLAALTSVIKNAGSNSNVASIAQAIHNEINKLDGTTTVTTKDHNTGGHKVIDETRPFQGNNEAKWVKVTHVDNKGVTRMAGQAIDKHGGDRDQAIEAGKATIKRATFLEGKNMTNADYHNLPPLQKKKFDAEFNKF